MGLSKGQLDALLPLWMKGAQEQEQSSQAAAVRSAGAQAERDAALAQLLKGHELKQQAEQEQYQRELNTAQDLRKKYGPAVSIDSGRVRLGAVDPLEHLLTPGQKAADVAFGKEYADYVAGGGSEAANKNLSKLEEATAQLKAAKPSLIEQGVGYLPEAFRAALTPEAKSREDLVKSALQSTLRQVLGAQFTEKEGTQLLNRAYDPRLSPQENLKRVQLEAEALKSQLGRKMQSAEQFERTGSIRGIKGASSRQSKASSGLSAAEQAELEQLRKELGR